MFSLEPARTDQHYDALLQLVYHQKTAYLDAVLDLIELTQEQFCHYFRSTGTAYRITQDQALVGLCWVDERQGVLCLLGLVIKEEYQGRRLGSQALDWLEAHSPASIQAIELQVHSSNSGARKLYERMGYRQTNFDPETGFYTMEKRMGKAALAYSKTN